MIRETFTLVEAIKKMYPVITFFKDRYFPDDRTFYSQKVLIESKKGGRKVAPFVVPVVNGIAMTAEGYRTDMVTAPMIAPKMVITAQDLENLRIVTVLRSTGKEKLRQKTSMSCEIQ